MKPFLRHSCFGLLLAFLVLASLLAPLRSEAVAETIRAELCYQEEGKDVRHGGEAMLAGNKSRLDARLGKAGLFTLLVDRESGKMQLLSHRLKGCVESKLDENARNWRDIVRSVSSMLMPQTLGMVSFEEKSCIEQGRERVQGYEAVKSRCVFTLGFMGSFRTITMEVWESPVFAPFPLKVSVIGDRDTHGAVLWFEKVQPVKEEVSFLPPEGYTRFSSVLDLILYAITMN
jgi:hypothetical protein